MGLSNKDRILKILKTNSLTSDEIALFEGDGKTTRHIKVKTLDEIDEKSIVQLLNLVYSKD